MISKPTPNPGTHQTPVETLSQTRRDDNKNKICIFEGGWAWGSRGELSQNAVFRRKRHDNKILKVLILLS